MVPSKSLQYCLLSKARVSKRHRSPTACRRCDMDAVTCAELAKRKTEALYGFGPFASRRSNLIGSFQGHPKFFTNEIIHFKC